MSKKTKKKNRPALSIKIRGDDLRIDASFSDARLSETLADLIKRASSAAGSAGTSHTDHTSPGPLTALIAELGRTLRRDQVDVLVNTLDMAQKILFMEILNSAQHGHVS